MNQRIYRPARRLASTFNAHFRVRSLTQFGVTGINAIAILLSWGAISSPLRAEINAEIAFVDQQIDSANEFISTVESSINKSTQISSVLDTEATASEVNLAVELDVREVSLNKEVSDSSEKARTLEDTHPDSEVTTDLEPLPAFPSSTITKESLKERGVLNELSVRESEEVTTAATYLEDAPSTSAALLVLPAEVTANSPAIVAQADGSDRVEASNPDIQLQGVALFQRDQFSARARASGVYTFSPSFLVGATVDLLTGDAFGDAVDEVGLELNELYAAVSLVESQNLRLVVGLIDLTSYFDRNSFAKDAATQFFNSAFQTNPALASAGLASRPGVLLGWDITDNIAVRAAGYSSSRDLGEFALDAAAAELALRFGTVILRGTYATGRDAGAGDSFQEVGQIDRGNDRFGVRDGDREVAYGLNAEVFIPNLNLGLFGRYGWYDNTTIDEGGQVFSLGLNLLDVFLREDRLGLGYGRQLSNRDLREDEGGRIPDVMELFYDARLTPNLRAGISLQGLEEFSETVLGLRIRADFRL